jgi:hypothetical protein
MDPPKLNSGLDTLDHAECLRLAGTQTVGRLGIIVGGRPEIHPVNFVLAGEHVVIRSDQGTKLSNALSGPVVFEVDHFDLADHTGWSVMIHGDAQLAGGHMGRSESRGVALRPWREADLRHLLRVVPTKITGRRLSAPEPHRWPPAGSADLDIWPDT